MRQLDINEISAVAGGEGNNGSTHTNVIGGMLAGAGTGAVAGGGIGFLVGGPVGAAVGAALGTGIGAIGGALSGFAESSPPKSDD